MKTAICSLAAVLVGVLVFVALKPNESRQNDHREPAADRVSKMHQRAVADGARPYSIVDRSDRKYNTVFVVRRDYPDRYSICSHLWFDAKAAAAGKDFRLFVKRVSADEKRPKSIRLYYGMPGFYSTSTFELPVQATKLTEATDDQLSWGKFFCKTTTSPEAKIASPGTELAAGESGYFLFPMYSREPISAVDFGRVIALIKEPVLHN